jgi:hypothetical protein
MRTSLAVKLGVMVLALGISSCAAIEAERHAEETKQQELVHRVDVAHIWVTTGTPPPGKPYTVLGEISYTEPFTPEGIEESAIEAKLKKIAMEKWPDTIDAVIKETSQTSDDGSKLTVTAQAIQYESTQDRTALHKMIQGED